MSRGPSPRLIGTRLMPSSRCGSSCGQRGLGARAAIGGGDQADGMAARVLLARKVDDVAEQAADRRPQDVKDAERCHSQRSAMLMVSPGRTG